jgi:hypothetical protein
MWEEIMNLGVSHELAGHLILPRVAMARELTNNPLERILREIRAAAYACVRISAGLVCHCVKLECIVEFAGMPPVLHDLTTKPARGG